MIRHLAANFLTLLVVGLIVLAGVIAVGVQSFGSPGPLSQPTRVVLERGVGLNGATDALIEAGAIDGLSIGYRTLKASKDAEGRRVLNEVELWEVSLVTFPMLPEARIGSKAEASAEETLRELAGVFTHARDVLAGRT